MIDLGRALGVKSQDGDGSVHAQPERLGLPSWVVTVGVLLVAFALAVSRRPDALFNAQFWAEDGVWYGDAYAAGPWVTLLWPHAGYLTLVTRLAADVALLVPLADAPLVLNVLALVLEALPAAFLLSGRCDQIVPHRGVRVLLALLSVGVPYAVEVHATITNAFWHLILLALLVTLARPPASLAGRAFDAAVIALSGLSGPFGALLACVIATHWWWTRAKYTAWLFALNAVAVAAQVLTFLGPGWRERTAPAALGANPITLARLIAGPVMLGAVTGAHGYSRVAHHAWWFDWPVPVAIALAGVACGVYAVWRGPEPLRQLILLSALIFATSLAAPLVPPGIPAWTVLTYPGEGARYVYLPIIAALVTLVWLATRPAPRLVRAGAVLVLGVALLYGMPADWRQPAVADLRFRTQAARFAALPRGQSLTIPINPRGWSVTLVKR
ncbi:MAG TPA: hypothetical protein VGR57_17320 [Ktedonobacterales bacterium]|nr:hypothetical protein [Ktedonobacterales bacterium]